MDPSLSSESIVGACSNMQYAARNYYLISLGCTSIKSSAHKEVIESLSKGPLYHRLLSLQTIHGSRDTQLLLHLFTNDPSRALQLRATKIVAAYAPDDGIIGASRNVGAMILGSLTRELKKRHRQNVIDAILQSLHKENEALFMKLLPYGSEPYVSKMLFDEGEIVSVNVRAWGRYAKILPRVAYRVCMERIEKGDSYGWGFYVYSIVNNCLPLLCHVRDGELGEGNTVVDIVRKLLGKSWVNMKEPTFPNLQCVVDSYPQEILPLLLAREERVEYLWNGKGYERLSVRELEALYQYTPAAIPATWKYGFPSLPKEKKVPIFGLAENHWRKDDGSMPITVVQNLPTKEREKEARRQLHLERNEANPLEKMQVAALLPWDEGLEANKPYIQNNDIDLRGPVLREQISAVRYQRPRLRDALELVTKRRYDNDVVRLAMLAALESLPQGMWKEEHLDALKEIYTQAFDAADLSVASQSELWDLALKLLPRFPHGMSPLLARLAGNRLLENRRCNEFDRSIPPEVLVLLEKELVPLLRRWKEKNDWDPILRFGEYFKDALDRVPQILDMVEEACCHSLSAWQIWIVITALKRYAPDHVPGLIQRILEDDLSKISIGSIENLLTRCPPSLLDKYLIEFGYKGASSTGTMQIIQFENAKATWTIQQQELYAKTLARAIREKVYSDSQVQPYVKLLAELDYSETASEALQEFASLEEERGAIRDTALRALGRLDGAKGLETLIHALSDERARIAIYALRGIVLKELSPSSALSLLKKVETKKVTVQKEVIRLMGDLNTKESNECLLEKEKDPSLHVDVRCALLRRLWNLDDDNYAGKEAIFVRNASHEHHAVLKTIAELPAIPLTPDENMAIDCTELLIKLVAKILRHPDTEVKMAVLKRFQSDPLPLEDANEADPMALQRQLESIIFASRNKQEILNLACQAYFAHFLSSSSPESANQPGSTVAELFQEILNRRDYKILTSVFNCFTSSPVEARLLSADGRPTAKLVLEVLRRDQLCQTLCVKLIFKLPGPDFWSNILQIAPSLHADALVTAEDLFAVLIQTPPKDLDWKALEKELRSMEDDKSRRLGLAALVALGRTTEGWTKERRGVLEEYRGDKSVLVAEAARFVIPPEEMEDGQGEKKR